MNKKLTIQNFLLTLDNLQREDLNKELVIKLNGTNWSFNLDSIEKKENEIVFNLEAILREKK